jgi:hypothetical protein
MLGRFIATGNESEYTRKSCFCIAIKKHDLTIDAITEMCWGRQKVTKNQAKILKIWTDFDLGFHFSYQLDRFEV